MLPNAYHRLSVVAKRARLLAAGREPPVTCPACETGLPPEDLLGHLTQRCTGARQPHHRARWLTWREALAIAPRANLSRWVTRGEVRTRGEAGPERRYLLRDVVQLVAEQRRGARAIRHEGEGARAPTPPVVKGLLRGAPLTGKELLDAAVGNRFTEIGYGCRHHLLRRAP
jgi:hypothetical protein